MTSLGSVANPYAAYDAMGNMTCRNVDMTTGHTCGGSTPTGATMTYDNQGRLVSWTAPSGTSADKTYLYDNQGNQVLATSAVGGTSTDTVYFDNYTETVLTSGTTATTKYYSLNGQRLAEKVNGTLYYLATDLLGNMVLALNSNGTAAAVALYKPYGQTNYSWGTMPTAQNYTSQRLDSQTGLLYYNFRWYDPFSGRFVRTDTKQNNANGLDPFAYVNGNPETLTD
ncbi:MAG TPA: RHS repeat-associated core domain-containing protein, partial [Ktedonobacteraceae bacterium]|nr:RHS repeat-associated core domain-containing protein [Ktedonobacteraceae bacterium]